MNLSNHVISAFTTSCNTPSSLAKDQVQMNLFETHTSGKLGKPDGFQIKPTCLPHTPFRPRQRASTKLSKPMASPSPQAEMLTHLFSQRYEERSQVALAHRTKQKAPSVCLSWGQISFVIVDLSSSPFTFRPCWASSKATVLFGWKSNCTYISNCLSFTKDKDLKIRNKVSLPLALRAAPFWEGNAETDPSLMPKSRKAAMTLESYFLAIHGNMHWLTGSMGG